MHPVLRRKFNTPDIRERLSRLPSAAIGLHLSRNECQKIREATRKALICIEDNQVTQLVASLGSLILKQVVDLQYRHDYNWGGTQGVYYSEENFIMAELLRLCLCVLHLYVRSLIRMKELTTFRDADLGYAALRNTTSVVFWLLSYQTNKVVWGSVYKTMRLLLASGSSSQGTYRPVTRQIQLLMFIHADSSAVDEFAAAAIKKLYFVCSCSEHGSAERDYWAKEVLSFASLFHR